MKESRVSPADLPPRPGSRLDPWIGAYADRAVGMKASEIRALFAVASSPRSCRWPVGCRSWTPCRWINSRILSLD